MSLSTVPIFSTVLTSITTPYGKKKSHYWIDLWSILSTRRITKTLPTQSTTWSKRQVKIVYWKTKDQKSSIVHERTDIFRSNFSSGLPAQVPLLKIDLVADVVPVRVRLHNYSSGQKEFWSTIVSELVDSGMIYPNPTSPLESSPLLVKNRALKRSDSP